MPLVWDEDLLYQVSLRTFLYDNKHPIARDFKARATAWLDIGEAVLGKRDKNTAQKSKQRWRSIRDTFVKALKIRSTTSDPAKATWKYKYEPHLQFLYPYMSDISKVNLQVSQEQYSDYTYQQPSVSMEELPDDGDDDCVEVISLDMDDSPIPSPELLQPIVQYNNSENDFDCTNSNASEPKSIRDFKFDPDTATDIDAFFHGLAQTVKTLKPITAAKLKKKIANIVIDAEIEELEDGLTTDEKPIITYGYSNS